MAVPKPYNPAAYVYGGATPKVAKQTQALGFKYTPPKPLNTLAPNKGYGLLNPGTTYTPPPTKPAVAPPSSESSQQSASDNGAGAVPGAAGSYIPGEGIYAQDSAAAYDAYNAAVAASEKDTQSARAQYGLNAEGSNLDPSNSTGLFQRLARSQAQTSDVDREEAIGRGLGGSGLGAQIGEQHDFQNQGDLADLSHGYQGLLAAAMARKGDANTTLTNALLSARQNQLNYDLQNQLFNAFNSSGTGADTTTSDNAPPPDAAPVGQPYIAPPDTFYNTKTKLTQVARPIVRSGQAWMN